MKKVLLITPLSFYGWHSVISAELEARGYSVDLMNDEYPRGILGLLLGNFLNAITRSLTIRKFERYLSSKENGYDLVLIFKGRGMSKRLVSMLSKCSKKVVAYNFDSFDYFGQPLRWYKTVDSYKTFDFEDSKKHGIERVDLFSERRVGSHNRKTVDFSCVMKNHSERLVYLDEIYSLFSDKYSFNVFIYEKNVLTFLRSFLKHPLLVFKWRKSISFVSLDSNAYADYISSSIFTLDYAHPSQSGITMRCFQSLANNTKIITSNIYVQRSDSIFKDLVCVYNLGDSPGLVTTFVEENISRESSNCFRGVKSFMDELLS
jgi:hypothetical protein